MPVEDRKTKSPGKRQATATLATKVIKSGEDGKGAVIEMIASTMDVDRDNDTIDQAGWDLEAYKKNPVVPFVHDYSQPPVARAVETEVFAGILRQVWEFTPRDMYPFGHMIGRMYELGYMSASSVGFMPTKWVYNDERGGFDFLEQELWENSAVVIPSNRNAIVSARDAGVDTEPFRLWAERGMDEGRDGLTRKFLEAIWMDTLKGSPNAFIIMPANRGAIDAIMKGPPLPQVEKALEGGDQKEAGPDKVGTVETAEEVADNEDTPGALPVVDATEGGNEPEPELDNQEAAQGADGEPEEASKQVYIRIIEEETA